MHICIYVHIIGAKWKMFTSFVENDFQLVILGGSCADKRLSMAHLMEYLKYLWWFALDWSCEPAAGQLRVEDVGWEKQGKRW